MKLVYYFWSPFDDLEVSLKCRHYSLEFKKWMYENKNAEDTFQASQLIPHRGKM